MKTDSIKRKKSDKLFLIIGSIVIAILVVRFLVKFHQQYSSVSNIDRVEDEVRDHYSNESDSLKLNAALFLIGGAKQRAGRYLDYWLLQKGDSKQIDTIDIRFQDYEFSRKIQEYFDTLASKDIKISPKIKIISDADTISSRFIIDHVDAMFKTRDYEWNSNQSYEDFLLYVLPYRCSSERLEFWHSRYDDLYRDMIDTLQDRSFFQVSKIIGDRLNKNFKFGSAFYSRPAPQGSCELIGTRMGDCYDGAHVTIFSLRSQGIAATVDYSPAWSRSYGSHGWVSAKDSRGIWRHFQGLEYPVDSIRNNPIATNSSKNGAKVFRKSFYPNPNSLACIYNKEESIPPLLRSSFIEDVTSEYVPVTEVEVRLNPTPKDEEYAYLAVYNNGEWKAVAFSSVREGQKSTLFKEMGVNNLYCPIYYSNNKSRLAGEPFLLNYDRSVQHFSMDSTKMVNNVATNRKGPWMWSDIDPSSLLPNREYILYYFNKEWISIDTITSTESMHTLPPIPSTGLYSIGEKASGEQYSRPFIISEGRYKGSNKRRIRIL